MSNNYELCETAKSILEGIGYQVTFGDGIQGVYGLIDKKTRKLIRKKADTIACCSNYESSSVDNGIPAEIYFGNYGERIFIGENGTVNILYNNGLKIEINSFQGSYEYITISFGNNIGEPQRIIFAYANKDDKKIDDPLINLGGIFVFYNNKFQDFLVHICHDFTNWCSFSEKYEYDEFSSDKVKEIIIDGIRSYDGSLFQSENLKKGIEVISPALDVFTSKFVSDWKSSLENRLDEEEKIRDSAKAIISEQEEKISNSFIRTVSAKALLNRINEDRSKSKK